MQGFVSSTWHLPRTHFGVFPDDTAAERYRGNWCGFPFLETRRKKDMLLTPTLESSPLFYKSLGFPSALRSRGWTLAALITPGEHTQLTILKNICTLKASSSKRSETDLLISEGCKWALGALVPTKGSFTWKPATGLKVAYGADRWERRFAPEPPAAHGTPTAEA